MRYTDQTSRSMILNTAARENLRKIQDGKRIYVNLYEHELIRFLSMDDRQFFRQIHRQLTVDMSDSRLCSRCGRKSHFARKICDCGLNLDLSYF